MRFAFDPRTIFAASDDDWPRGRYALRHRSGTSDAFPKGTRAATSSDAPPKPWVTSYCCSRTLRPVLSVPSLEECIASCRDTGAPIALNWNAGVLGDEAPIVPSGTANTGAGAAAAADVAAAK